MFLTTQEEQLKRWQEHFSEIFNQDDNKAERKQELRNVNVKGNNSENEKRNRSKLGPSYKN
jgi:hypothetical protein